MKASLSLLGRLSMLVVICCGVPSVGPQASEDKTIYKWVDAEGKVHFSDQFPTGGGAGLESQPLPSAVVPATLDAREDYYSIENQARRFEEARRVREAEREQAQKAREERRLRQEEIKAARAKREAAEAQKKAAEHPRTIYVPSYPWHGYPVPPIYPPVPLPKPSRPPKPEPDRPKMSLPKGIVR